MTSAEHLNKDALAELKMIMGDEFSMLLDTFRTDSVQRIEAIRQAVNEKDSEAIRRAAHSFKGSASNMGAVELCSLCRRLEELGFQGKTEGADQLFDAIEQEYELVSAELDAL